MMPLTDYEQFERSTPENRRLLGQEELILEVTVAMCEALKKERLTRTALAGQMGRTPGYITQLLSGGRNLTLRTLADFAGALNYRVRVKMCVNDAARQMQSLSIVSRAPSRIDLSFKTTEGPQIEIPEPPKPRPTGVPAVASMAAAA